MIDALLIPSYFIGDALHFLNQSVNAHSIGAGAVYNLFNKGIQTDFRLIYFQLNDVVSDLVVNGLH